MLYATGLTDDDMAKPQIGISSVWYEGKPPPPAGLELPRISLRRTAVQKFHRTFL